MKFSEQQQLQQKKAALKIRAINHPLRRQLMELCTTPMTVTEIYVKLRIEQSVASQHLAILRTAGWLKTTREGKFIRYSVNTERANGFNNVIELLSNS